MTKPSSGTLFTIESCNSLIFDMCSTVLKESNGRWKHRRRGALSIIQSEYKATGVAQGSTSDSESVTATDSESDVDHLISCMLWQLAFLVISDDLLQVHELSRHFHCASISSAGCPSFATSSLCICAIQGLTTPQVFVSPTCQSSALSAQLEQ
jgi:hypothetical protein